MKKHIIYFLALAIITTIGCQKELSFEGNNTPAVGSLQDDVSGDCLPKTVNGAYIAGTALVPATNTIAVQVNVTRTGSYTVYTDTVNGYYFRATGTFTTLGANTVTLRSSGTPFAAGVNNFVVTFDTTVCDIQITVLPAGTGPATFTLVSGGTPVNCASAVVSGTFVKDAALTTSHFVDVTVNVTVLGTYTIKATGGGMTFQKTAAFSTLGNQTVRLDGSGTPTVAGANTITFDPPFASCNFTVTVTAPVSGTLGGQPGACTPVTINGTYTQNVALTASNTVQVQITTSAVGPYSVSTNTVAGISFAASGTSTGATQTITLLGTGTPNASGTQNFTVTFGTSTCTFSIPIAGTANAVYTIDCPNVVVNGTYQVGVPLTAANTITLPVTVTTAGAYNISASINGMTFSSSGNLTLASTTITLNGSLTPTGPANTYNLSVGTPACLIPITVTAAVVIDWTFKVGTTTYQGTTDQVFYDNSTPPFVVVDYYGTNPAVDDFNIAFLDVAGGIVAGETYNSNVVTLMNASYFYFLGAGIELEASDPATTPGVNILLTVTSHNTTTRTIVGTFSGTAFDYVSSTNKTITNGQFTAVY